MTALLAGVAAVAVPLVLLASVYGHARRPGMLASALRAHGTVPRALAGPAAAAVVAAEALAGAAGATALLLQVDGPMRAASGASAVLLALYAAYATYVSRTRHDAPCGCAGAGTPMTGWVAGRAAALSVLALIGALHGLPGGPSAYESFIAVTAGLGFAVLLWTLPSAMIERRSAG
ncbi:methylamine utilization protein MauE [Actinomadura soli]|uniref:Methylamine utilization protein MauE n=1 Tax=Actinomadura soli TaxID=2508997 RepID=A0A5C4JHW4_9ACTN|nr:MauE/DoxX family redox-associated membrane protein [Actinomadura soli]TMR06479.1 methylamine utilization protein MauE [Actinomadura soli]